MSACSEYFKNIFQQTKQSQPLLCLEGVNAAGLQNVLDYVYDGEVKILQEDLDGFLFIANRLKLNGLISEKTDDLINEETIKQDYTEDHFIANEGTHNQAKEMQSESSTKQMLKPFKENSKDDSQVRIQIDQIYEENVEAQTDGSLLCKMCGKVVNKANRNKVHNMKIHLQVHLNGLTYDCQVCNKEFKSQNSLNFHRYSKHRN